MGEREGEEWEKEIGRERESVFIFTYRPTTQPTELVAPSDVSVVSIYHYPRARPTGPYPWHWCGTHRYRVERPTCVCIS